MFQLDKHEASITNVNQRIQRHGDERRLAADIKFNLSIGNESLDAFDPTLRQDLFRKPGAGEQQELPTIGGDRLTEVKHPALEPLKLSHELTGYEPAHRRPAGSRRAHRAGGREAQALRARPRRKAAASK